MILARSGRDERRKIKPERRHEREEAEKDDQTQREAAGNKEKEGITQVAVAVEIPRRREENVRPETRDREDSYLRMRQSEETVATEDLEASQHATTKTTDTTSPINVDATT